MVARKPYAVTWNRSHLMSLQKLELSRSHRNGDKISSETFSHEEKPSSSFPVVVVAYPARLRSSPR